MRTDCVAATSGTPSLFESTSTQTVWVYCWPLIVQSGLGNPPLPLTAPSNVVSTPRFGWLLIIRTSVGMNRRAAWSRRNTVISVLASCRQRAPRRLMSLHELPIQTSRLPWFDAVDSFARPLWLSAT